MSRRSSTAFSRIQEQSKRVFVLLSRWYNTMPLFYFILFFFFMPIFLFIFAGTVRHFDLRKPHHCSNQSVRSFITSLRVPVRQTIRPNGRNVQRRCPEPILDYRDNNTYLNTLSINQLNQNYFAVAGQNEYIYLHDRRMLSKVECVNKFTSTGDVFKRKDKQVTAVKFSDYNGYEVIFF